MATRFELEPLEQRLLLSTVTVFSENFESIGMSNWTTNSSQGRQWYNNSYKSHGGSTSAFGSALTLADHTYANSEDNFMRHYVNLTGYASASLTFWYWMNTQSGYDGLRVNINGNTKAPTPLTGNSGGWKQATVDLTSFCGSSSVDILFDFFSDSSTVTSGDAGVWIDDVAVTATTVNTKPNTPTSLSPSGSISTLTPTLSAGAFSDPNAGDTHAASQWQVYRSSDSVVVFDSGTDTSHKTSITVSSDSLGYSTSYGWCVRYQDNGGLWSNWASGSFTTGAAPDSTPPTASLSDPANGGSISTATLNGRHYIDITFADTGGSGLNISSITDSAQEFSFIGAAAGGVVINGVPSLVSGSTYRYALTNAFGAGSVTVVFPDNAFSDIQGNPSAAASQNFTVIASDSTPPTASLSDPANGGSISTATLNGRHYIDITFADTGGSGLNISSITDSAQEFSFIGAAAGGVVINGVPSLVSGSTYRYALTNAFGAGSVTVVFPDNAFSDIQGNPSAAASQNFTVIASDSTPPTASLSDPANGGSISTATLNGRHYIDITFADTGGSGLNISSITDSAQEFSFIGAAAGGVVINGVPSLVSGSTYRYALTNAFGAGSVTVVFPDNAFSDIQGNPSAAASQNFTVIASDSTPPTASLSDPANGGSISTATLNGRHYIDITFADTGGSGLNISSITDSAQEFSFIGAAAGGVVINGVPSLVSGSTYRYALTNAFGAGSVTVVFPDNAFSDIQGNPSAAASQNFTVIASDSTPPTASLSDPANGGSISTATLNGRHYIDITFADTGGSGLNISSITDSAQEFSFIGAAAGGVVINGVPSLVSGSTYRYALTNAFGAGSVTVVFPDNAFSDIQGNPSAAASQNFTVIASDSTPPTASLSDPANGGSISTATLNGRHYIDITFADTGGSGLNISSITDSAQEFSFIGAAAGGVVINGVPSLVSGSTYRYTFTGQFVKGPVTVSFLQGSVADGAGNTNAASTATFTVLPTMSGVFDMMNLSSGFGKELSTIVPRIAGAAWDKAVTYLSKSFEIDGDLTVGLKFGFQLSGDVGEGAQVAVAEAKTGFSIAYSIKDGTWTIAKGFELEFAGDRFSLEGEQYIIIPPSDTQPIVVGLNLTGDCSLLTPPPVKTGIEKGLAVAGEPRFKKDGDVGVNYTLGIETDLSKTEFLTATNESSLGMAVLDSFGFWSSSWYDSVISALGRITGSGLPIISALGVGHDPLALLSSHVMNGGDLRVSLKRGASAEGSLKVNIGVGLSAFVGLSATVFAEPFVTLEGENTIFQQTYSAADLAASTPDDVGNSAVASTAMTSGTTYSYRLDAYDKDVFSFSSTAGQHHEFNLASGVGGARQYAVSITDADGTILSRITVASSAIIPFDAADAGTYYLSVEYAKSTVVGAYSLSWSCGVPDGTFTKGLDGYTGFGTFCLVPNSTNEYAVELREHSPSGISTTVTVPAVNPRLTFDYKLVAPGDGDQFEVRIGGTIVWTRTIDMSQSGFTSVGPIDLAAYAGETVTIEFLLDSVGSANAAFDVDNIALMGDESYTFYSKGSARVSMYSMGGESLADAAKALKVVFGRNDSVSSISINDNVPADVGIVIAGATSVGSIVDVRRAMLKDLSFIVSNAPIRSLAMKGAITGWNLNGVDIGGVALPSDVDGDGSTTDKTAIYTAAGLSRSFDIRGQLLADVVAAGGLSSLKHKSPLTDLDVVIGPSSNHKAMASLFLGQVSNVDFVSAMPIGEMSAVEWLDSGGGKDVVRAPSARVFVIAGRRANVRAGIAALAGRSEVDLVLSGLGVGLGKATLGKVRIAGDLDTSVWDIGGNIGAISVVGTARSSIVRASGDIAGITVGASDGSDVGAGVALDVLKGGRHVAVGDAGNTPTGTIKTFTVKGWKISSGELIPRFFMDSNISAKIGKVGLLNWDGQGGMFTLSGSVGSVVYKDTADPTKNWVYPALPSEDFVHII